MNRQNQRRKIVLLVTSLSVLFSPISRGQTQEPKERKEFIDMENGVYRVSPPPGKGWVVNVDTKNACVHFLNKKEILEISVLRLLKSIKPSWHRLGVDEIAGKLFDDIEDSASQQNLQIGGWGPPRIRALKRGETLVGDKRVFFLSYTEDMGPGGKMDVIWYHYFPTDFKKTFQFFAFRITQGLYDGPLAGIKPEPAYAVIRSLQVNSPYAPVPGIDGELIRAAADGKDDLVKELLNKGANSNASYPEGTPLAAAAFYGHPETVQILIARGADLQGKDGKFDATPLLCAIAGGEVEIAKLLIEKGADVNVKTRDGTTALIQAAESAPELVPILVEKGADVNAKTAEGRTALFYAAWMGDAGIIPFLIEKKADLNAPMKNGWTPLMQALDTNHFDIALLLLNKGAGVNLKADTGWTALMAAISRGAGDDLLKGLIEHGADVNARWKSGRTPLMLAIHTGKTEVVRLLADHGADLNQKQDDGQTALMLAASEGHLEIVNLLIEKGADVNAVDNNSRTALKIAMGNKDNGEQYKAIEVSLRKAGAK